MRERFEIMRVAVSGTMSKFYMARDLKSNRIVGLKIADEEKVVAFEARFKGLNKPSEGAIAISMRHPLVVETYEHGITTDGRHYIVMEFVKGLGLHQILYNAIRALKVPGSSWFGRWPKRWNRPWAAVYPPRRLPSELHL